MIAGVVLFAPVADAQSITTVRPGGRPGLKIFHAVTYLPPWNMSGQGGSKVDLDATWGFGFGFGYNLSDHFQMNGLFSWSARNYDATLVEDPGGTPRKFGSTEYSSTFSLNGIFYLLPGDISPFVSGGLGIAYIDTSIPTGVGQTVCWWDPWYGYVCNSRYPTKTE
jgi:opacity protein-like surface antigen